MGSVAIPSSKRKDNITVLQSHKTINYSSSSTGGSITVLPATNVSDYSQVLITLYVTNNGYYANPDIYLDNVKVQRITGSGYRYNVYVDVSNASTIKIISTWGASNAGTATVGAIVAI